MRSRATTGIAALHAVWTVLMAAVAVICLWLVRSQRDNARELLLGAAVMAAITIVFAFATVGLWRVRRWAWLLSFVVNALVILFLAWDVFIDRDRDPDNWIVLVLFGVPMLLLLLPPVRRPFFRKITTSTAT